jgi:hypothetical protein
MRLSLACLSIALMFQVSPPQPKTAIEGVVLQIGTERPVSGVQIALNPATPTNDETVDAGGGTDLLPVPHAITDREGHFVLNKVIPGSYRLTAARNGFTKQDYGQRLRYGRGTVLTLTAGQTLKGLTIRLTPTGTISGQVRDYNGEPIAGLKAEVLRPAYDRNGKRHLQFVVSARTDDRGEYRLYWLTPGPYFVSVGQGAHDRDRSNPNEILPSSYATLFYPGFADPWRAAAIDVPPGVEVNGIDFALESPGKRQLHRITGRVVGAGSQPFPGNVEISVTTRSDDAPVSLSNLNHQYDRSTGTFEIRGVPPGSYMVAAIPPPDFGAPVPHTPGASVGDLLAAQLLLQPKGQVAVDVSGGDVDNVAITLTGDSTY